MKRAENKYERVPVRIAGRNIYPNNLIHDVGRRMNYRVYAIRQGQDVIFLYNPMLGLRRYTFAVIEKALACGDIVIRQRFEPYRNYGYMNYA